MTSYLVRPATDRDVKAVQDLARRVRREMRLSVRWPAREASAERHDFLWVVEAGRGEIVGCCGVRERGDGEWELHSLYLGPEWRGLGLGRALAEHALHAGRLHGALTVRFAAPAECLAAHSLARSLGFLPRERAAGEDVQRWALTFAGAN